MSSPIHPDFKFLLDFKEKQVIDLFMDLRNFILDIWPDSIELLYHTHALTSVFSLSDKLADAFCMIPIYTNHLNLGFNKGTLLNDAGQLLHGTGRLIRHIPVKAKSDYRNELVTKLILNAVDQAKKDMTKFSINSNKVISKIKR